MSDVWECMIPRPLVRVADEVASNRNRVLNDISAQLVPDMEGIGCRLNPLDKRHNMHSVYSTARKQLIVDMPTISFPVTFKPKPGQLGSMYHRQSGSMRAAIRFWTTSTVPFPLSW